jgi:hypothetical protein
MVPAEVNTVQFQQGFDTDAGLIVPCMMIRCATVLTALRIGLIW